ncbi:ThiF family adenylyltransferase [Vibrio vulnificus]|nr:ThiF family adenylyltransferase [Vibrio vulnificus]
MRKPIGAALLSLGSALSKRYNARLLTSKKAKEWKLPLPQEHRAWVIKTDITLDGGQLALVVLAKETFPYEPPKIYVRPHASILKHPHIEDGGRLCVWSNLVAFNPHDHSYIHTLVNDAYEMVSKTIKGQLDDDFDNGFLSYWINAYPHTLKVSSLNNLQWTPSRQIYAAYTKQKGVVFADCSLELNSWLERAGVKPKYRNITTSILISLDKPWKPSEYPKTLGEIEDILIKQRWAPELLNKCIADLLSVPKPFPIFLVRVETPNGIACVGMSIETNALGTGNRGKAYRKPALGNGYRPGRVSNKVLFSRSRNLKLNGVNVDRKDISWMLGRDRNKALKDLGEVKVAVLGLGSVGSGLLPLLVRAGFKKFVLVDGDILEPANIGRHWLGEHHVGQNKAKACEDELNRMFPWVEVSLCSQTEWFKDEATTEEIKDCDVIVNATGEWASDCAMRDLIGKEDITSPVVFCFTEAHATATHCFIDMNGSFDYFDLFDCTGILKTPVTTYQESTVEALPSCGGFYQPYGAIELSYGHGMICETICNIVHSGEVDSYSKHTVWVGRKSLVESTGGTWNRDWVIAHGDPDQGSRIIRVEELANGV